jgi:hypothetical protein
MKKRKDKHPVCTSKGGQDGSAHTDDIAWARYSQKRTGVREIQTP